MKDAQLIMEQTCRQDIKKLCVLYVSYVVLAMLLTFFDQQKFQGTTTVTSIALFVITFILITGIHRKRMKRMVSDGAFHRILLLPVKRTSLLVSEFLFTFASYAILFILPIIVWMLWYLNFQEQLPQLKFQFAIYSLFYHFGNLIMPFDAKGILLFIIFLTATTLTINYLLLSFTIKDRQGIAVLFLLLMGLVAFISKDDVLLKCGGYFLISCFTVRALCNMMRMNRRKRS